MGFGSDNVWGRRYIQWNYIVQRKQHVRRKYYVATGVGFNHRLDCRGTIKHIHTAQGGTGFERVNNQIGSCEQVGRPAVSHQLVWRSQLQPCRDVVVQLFQRSASNRLRAKHSRQVEVLLELWK